MEELLKTYSAQMLQWLFENVFNAAIIAQWAFVAFALVLTVFLTRVIRPRYTRWVERTISNEMTRSMLLAPTGIGRCIIFLLFAQMGIGICIITMDTFPHWLFAANDLAVAWVAIRLLTFIIPNKAMARVVAISVWSIAVLHILGLLEGLTIYLRGLSLNMGGSQVSVYGALKGVLMAALCLQLAALVARFVSGRINAIKDLSPSLKVLLTKVVNIALYTTALLFAMSSVGIDLTSLAIFSSALGVGVGFGLKTIFSNYIAGVLLLADNSIKPGDTIEVGNVFGVVKDMHARYASVLTRSGKEYLIPNEQMITNEVVNWTYSNKRIRLNIPVGVAYDTDLNFAKEHLEKAALHVDRVLTFPAPQARLVGFGDNSIDFELRFWIRDAESGVTNVKSEVRFKIWEAFKENDIEFPFPQRDVAIKPGSTLQVELTGNDKKADQE